ncbi:hypothetical protein ACFLYK_02435 [Candidatus Cloacimonadota bacterium]
MSEEFVVEERKQKKLLSERFNRIGWGIFLVMLGVIWILPENVLPDGVLPIGVGIILLGMYLLKKSYGLKGSDSNVLLGIIAIAIGLGDLLKTGFPLIPVILIFWGMSMIYRIIFPRKIT